MTRLLRAVEHQIAVFSDESEPDYDVLVGAADYFLDSSERCHHPKEDAILVRFVDLYPVEAAGVVELFAEHRELHQLAHRFRDTVGLLLNGADVARDVVVAAAQSFVMEKRRHLLGEEQRFFPLVESLLKLEDWSEIEGGLTQRSDPLFGSVEAKFRALSDRLLTWEAEDEEASRAPKSPFGRP